MAEPTCYRTNFFIRQFRLTKWYNSTTRNAPCVHPRLDSPLILQMSRVLPIAVRECSAQSDLNSANSVESGLGGASRVFFDSVT